MNKKTADSITQKFVQACMCQQIGDHVGAAGLFFKAGLEMVAAGQDTVTTSGAPLAHAAFSRPPLHIPNGKGQPFKTELVEERSPERTVKWNWWHLPDDDRDPHNHPWDFESTVLHGQLVERRWWVEGGEVKSITVVHTAPDTYTIRRHEYHTVTAVAPGTVTRMVCGQATESNAWGYLNPKNGLTYAAQPEPDFMARLRALNPFLVG